jgi:hypothetical protein
MLRPDLISAFSFYQIYKLGWHASFPHSTDLPFLKQLSFLGCACQATPLKRLFIPQTSLLFLRHRFFKKAFKNTCPEPLYFFTLPFFKRQKTLPRNNVWA